MRFLGIMREPVFSPGRVDDDAAILLAVAAALRQGGHSVQTFNADEAGWPEPTADSIVFTMAQGDRALQRLSRWEQHGIRVVNHSDGVLNCQRHRTVPLLSAAGVPFPTSHLMATGDAAAALPEWIEAGAWVKRGDVHATEADDVVHVDSIDATRAALSRFAERDITRAVLQRHVPGMVLKFYAVLGRFFHCVEPTTGPALPLALLAQIDALGQRAAQVLGVEVYGGDCVHGADGTLTLIDLNDWPSYARCRFAAATAIAAYVETSETSIT